MGMQGRVKSALRELADFSRAAVAVALFLVGLFSLGESLLLWFHTARWGDQSLMRYLCTTEWCRNPSTLLGVHKVLSAVLKVEAWFVAFALLWAVVTWRAVGGWLAGALVALIAFAMPGDMLPATLMALAGFLAAWVALAVGSDAIHAWTARRRSLRDL